MFQVTQMAFNSSSTLHKPSPGNTQHNETKLEVVTTLSHASSVNVTANFVMTMWNTSTRVVLSTTMLLIMTVAIVGNLLVITVILQNRGMRTRTNMFLCSLAISDLLCAVLDMPFSLVTVVTGRRMFNQTLCQLNGFLMPLFFVASIHLLMYMSIHKYVSIRNPFSVVLNKPRILAMVAAAWAWAIVMSTLTVAGPSTVEHKLYTTQCGAKIPKDVKAFSHLALVLVTCYVAPLAVIIFCYSRLFRHIRKYGDRLEKTSTTDRNDICAQQRRILLTLFLVVVMFIVSWTPWVFYSVYVTIIQDETSAGPLANPITYWFGYLNSACNPIIYAFRSEAFRDGYREALCRCSRKRFKADSRNSSNISDRFRLVNSEYPCQLKFPLSTNSKSPAKAISENRLSTYSLPLNAINHLQLGPLAVCPTSEHQTTALNGYDRPGTAREPTSATANSHQSLTDKESYPKKQVCVSKSFDFQANSVRTLYSDISLPEGANGSEKDDLVSGICFYPKLRSLDCRATGRPRRHGINFGGCTKETTPPLRSTAKGITGDPPLHTTQQSLQKSAYPKIRAAPRCEIHESVGNLTEPQVEMPSYTGTQTGQNEMKTNPKTWRKRLSTRWKRNSQKASHNYPHSSASSSSSKAVRRSVTTKPVPHRYPSVERLDHSSKPRQRTMTEVPAGYKRRKADADHLGPFSGNPQLDQVVNRRETRVCNTGDKVHEAKRPEEKELLTALDWLTSASDDCKPVSPLGANHPVGRLLRFLSDPCGLKDFSTRNNFTNRFGTSNVYALTSGNECCSSHAQTCGQRETR